MFFLNFWAILGHFTLVGTGLSFCSSVPPPPLSLCRTFSRHCFLNNSLNFYAFPDQILWEAEKWSSCCQGRPDPGGRNDVRSWDLATWWSLFPHFTIFTFKKGAVVAEGSTFQILAPPCARACEFNREALNRRSNTEYEIWDLTRKILTKVKFRPLRQNWDFLGPFFLPFWDF